MAQSFMTSAFKPTSKDQTSASSIAIQVPRCGLFAFMAAFAGVIVAVPLTIALMMPMVHQQLASALSQGNKTVQLKNADSLTSCTPPAGGSGGAGNSNGAVLGASTSNPGGGNGGGQGGGGTTFVKKLVNGVFTSTGTISNTGQDSHNSVTTTDTAIMTITNDNDLSVNNTNHQDASSGDASSNKNTNGGAATSGDSTNTNNTNVNYSVSN